MSPLLDIVVEHVFSVFDGNVEVLQSSVDRCDSFIHVVGLDSFELLKNFFELLHCCVLVSSRDTELLDIGLFIFCSIEPMISTFVETL